MLFRRWVPKGREKYKVFFTRQKLFVPEFIFLEEKKNEIKLHSLFGGRRDIRRISATYAVLGASRW